MKLQNVCVCVYVNTNWSHSSRHFSDIMIKVTTSLHIVTESNFTLGGKELALTPTTFHPSPSVMLTQISHYSIHPHIYKHTMTCSPPKKVTELCTLHKHALKPNISYIHGQVSTYTLWNSCHRSHTHRHMQKHILQTVGEKLYPSMWCRLF